MFSANRKQVKDIFQATLDRPPDERERFLTEACGGDAQLQREVRGLLDSFEKDAEINADGKPGKVEVGQRLGHFTITQKIGAGGMGEVFLARDSRLERFAALKILPDAFAADAERVRRFMQEAKAASALNHPNILTVYEIGQFENSRFIATEFIEGVTLRERMNGGEPLSIRESLDIAAQIAAALNAAHSAGIVHRDVKPENIMLRGDGLVKVLDFGLAKLVEKSDAGEAGDAETETLAQINTTPGMIMGTAAYMSPEQARGKFVDARSDVWSLGVLLYEMLAGGRAPFAGETTSDVIASILRSEPAPPDKNTPAELNRIIRKSLQKNAAERYQTVADFMTDLKNLHRQQEFAKEIERAKISQVAKTENFGAVSGENFADSLTQSFGAKHLTAATAPEKNRYLSTGFLTALVVIALAAVGGYFMLSPSSPRSQTINSVAVLPFVNGSNDANLDYLSDGLSERLIDGLSQLPQLKVISRSSSFKYRGNDVDLKQIANTLGVQAIIVGRVVQRGNTLTVRAELVDCRESTPQQFWSDQYVRPAADLQAVQENIVQTVTENLRLKLTGTQEERLTKHATQNPQAYQLYLNGLFFQRKGGKENVRKALDFYNQAIALDPNFALAYTQTAGVYNSFGGSGEMNPKEAIPKAKAAAQKALEIDETLAEAHSVLAVVKRFEWDWAGTETELRRAIELNPNLAAAHSNYAIYLSNMERHAESLAEIKRSQSIDPLYIGFQVAEGGILQSARRYDEAIRLLQNIIRTTPDSGGAHEYLAYAYNSKGMYREAVAEFEAFSAIEGDLTTDKGYLGFAYAKLGKRNEALAVLEKLKTTDQYVSPTELAILYAGLGDKEKAFDALEKAFAAHDLQLQFLKVDSHYDSLRSDARFQDLLRRVGLPE